MKTEISLQIIITSFFTSDPEATKRYSGKKYVQMSYEDMEKIGANTGDLISVKAANSKHSIGLLMPQDNSLTGKIGVDRYFYDTLNIKETSDIVQISVHKDAVEIIDRLVLHTDLNIKKWTEDAINTLKRSIRAKYTNIPLLKDDIIVIFIHGKFSKFYVHALPNLVTTINATTNITVEYVKITLQELGLDAVGGMNKVKARLEELVVTPLLHPELFKSFRPTVKFAHGIILHGAPGCGKTMIAKALAKTTNAHFIYHTAGDIFKKYYGEAESNIRELFEEAQKNAPSIIFIDEFDTVGAKRAEIGAEMERRVVTELLVEMEKLKDSDSVIVIAATNRINDIDQAFRRSGRFEHEIAIDPPTYEDRLEILKIHTCNIPMIGIDLKSIAKRTNGYVGADLSGVINEATLSAIRRARNDFKLDIYAPAKILPKYVEKIQLTQTDFEYAITVIKPSVLRESFIEVAKIDMNDIVGLERPKKAVEQAILWNINPPKDMEKLVKNLPRNILLYGAPGCGKTMLGQAIASQPNYNFIYVKGPEFYSKWIGETEKAVRDLFTKARQAQPCVIFIDEIDALLPIRSDRENTESGVIDRVVNQFLIAIGGLEDRKNIVVMGATNRPDKIDPAVFRKGRFDYEIYVAPPDEFTRKKIFQLKLAVIPNEEINYDQLAKLTENYTGADIGAVVQFASIHAFRNNQKIVKMENLETTIRDEVKPSITDQLIMIYKKFEDRANRSAIVRYTMKDVEKGMYS